MTNGKLPMSFWVVAAIALVWDLMGVAAFAMQVTMGEEALQAMSAAERDLYASIPALGLPLLTRSPCSNGQCSSGRGARAHRTS